MRRQSDAQSGGQKLHAYRVRCRIGDALLCHKVDGLLENPNPVLVAVNSESRMVASEKIIGVTWDYTYELTDALNPRRIARAEGVQRIEILHPAYPDECQIQAMQTDYSGVNDSDGQDIKLVEISARRWVKDHDERHS